MARPTKQMTVEYFPHVCRPGKNLTIIDMRFGNDGYTLYFRIREMLGDEEGHILDTKQPDTWELIVLKARLKEDRCTEILDLMAKLGDIDLDLWTNDKVIWCQELVNDLSGVYAKRTTGTPKKPSFRSGNSQKAEFPEQEPQKTGVSAPEVQQRRVKHSIVEQSICAQVSDSETPHQDDASPSELSCLASHSWETFRTVWTPAIQNGKFIGEGTCRKLWDKTPAMWNQWTAAAKNYVISKRVRDGFPMDLMKFLSGAWEDWQTPETPSGPAAKPDFSWRDERDQDEARFAEGQRIVASGAEGYRPRDKLPFETEEEYADKRAAGRLQMVPEG